MESFKIVVLRVQIFISIAIIEKENEAQLGIYY